MSAMWAPRRAAAAAWRTARAAAPAPASRTATRSACSSAPTKPARWESLSARFPSSPSIRTARRRAHQAARNCGRECCCSQSTACAPTSSPSTLSWASPAAAWAGSASHSCGTPPPKRRGRTTRTRRRASCSGRHGRRRAGASPSSRWRSQPVRPRDGSASRGDACRLRRSTRMGWPPPARARRSSPARSSPPSTMCRPTAWHTTPSCSSSAT